MKNKTAQEASCCCWRKTYVCTPDLANRNLRPPLKSRSASSMILVS